MALAVDLDDGRGMDERCGFWYGRGYDRGEYSHGYRGSGYCDEVHIIWVQLLLFTACLIIGRPSFGSFGGRCE
jgi:hypothetical protein